MQLEVESPGKERSLPQEKAKEECCLCCSRMCLPEEDLRLTAAEWIENPRFPGDPGDNLIQVLFLIADEETDGKGLPRNKSKFKAESGLRLYIPTSQCLQASHPSVSAGAAIID